MKKILPIVLFFTFLLIICLIAGLYSGGYSALHFSNANTALLTWHTFTDVISAFSGNVHYKKVVAYAWAGFAAPLVVWCIFVVVFVIALMPKKILYGDARLANYRDLQQSGFFPKKSAKKPASKHPAILMGKMFKGRFKNRYIHFYGQQFLILYAPTRSGKGVGIVIPNCIFYTDSMVVLDIKLENFFLSAGWRKKCGHEVFLFCPAGFAKTEAELKAGEIQSHRWNPLDCVNRSSIQRQSDMRRIAAMIYPLSGGENDIWSTAAINLFVGLGLYLLDMERVQYQNGTPEAERVPVSISQLLKTSIPKTGDLAKWMVAELKNNPDLSDETAELFRQFCAAPDKTRGSIISNFTTELAIFNNPVTAAATSYSDFDIRDVRKKKMTIYLGLTPNTLISHAKLVNLFFSMLIGENTQELPENNPSLIYQCLLLLDEFTSMGKSEIIQKSVPYTAGYNLRFLFILQNKGQLDDLYGKEGTETFVENTGAEIFYPPKTINDMANTISEKIGVRDEKVREKSTSSGQGSSRTTSFRVMERAALLPEEIVSLRDKKNNAGNMAIREIVFSDYCRPFIASKIVYFEDKYFMDRVNYSRKHPVNIPLLFEEDQRQQIAKELAIYSSGQIIKMPDLDTHNSEED